MHIGTRLSAVILLQVGVVVAIILAFSGTPMGAQDSGITTNAQPLSALQAEPAPAPVAPVVIGVPDEAQFVGSFVGSGPFRVVGDLLVLDGGFGEQTISFSPDFRTNRSPELAVVLRSDSGEAVNLGPLQAIQGGQTYSIPALTNLGEFNTVQIWDTQADIDLGSARLTSL